MTPRLRVTSLLSLLALLVGVLGTQWLSGQTAGWSGPHHPVVAEHTAPPALRYRADRERRALPRVVAARATGAAPVPPPPPELVPISMPPLSARYAGLAGHLAGNLVLHLQVDGEGGVVQAAVARSSGDPVLDAHARAMVARWRFAVPPDHPQGLSGDLPMHFGQAAAD
ncbi:MAG: energy transducer TonB [Xanthomonadaceae bacterium]|nr:energy transducer TonB [Xanthomonadaceae bacterium]MDE1965208.1 energy transducer TonB [Xanthomonadaceae bacterium]